ncbi:MAG: ACP S-malonyltransferase [Burkholderiales bacterium]|nr:ACP S-malonyltransferase [Burkholderiales bacterium]
MKLGMVFPGQGSQSVGMLAAYGDLPEIRHTLEEASQALGQDLGRLIAEGPAGELGRTINTQPVMLSAGVAAYRAWRALGGSEPAMVAGHSLGEYTALVVAGALDFSECLPLVRLRAAAMQEAVPEGAGAMAAVMGLEAEALQAACREAANGEVVEAVNFNAPGQIVIAGHAAAVRRGVEAARARGAKRAVILPVSAPFHSSLMAPAAAKLRAALVSSRVRTPLVPVVHNVDAATHPDPDALRDALYRQADHPVRWSQCIQAMAEAGITHVFECGPGKVLAGLSHRICGELTGLALSDRQGLEEGLQMLRGIPPC